MPSLSPLSSLVNMYEHTYIHHLDPAIKAGGGGGGLKKQFFSSLLSSVWSKNKGGGGRATLGPSPGSATVSDPKACVGGWWFK